MKLIQIFIQQFSPGGFCWLTKQSSEKMASFFNLEEKPVELHGLSSKSLCPEGSEQDFDLINVNMSNPYGNHPNHPYYPSQQPFYDDNFDGYYHPQNHQFPPQEGYQRNNYNHTGHERGSWRGRPQRGGYPRRARGFRGRNNFRGGRGRGGGPQQHQGSSNNGNSNSHKPWMTPELLQQIYERNELQRVSMNSKNPDDWRKFKTSQRAVNLALNDAKVLYDMVCK